MCGLYIHIPFCDRKCYYCAFAIVVGQLKKAEDYLACLKQEARRYTRPAVQSLYIGGGTPSTLTVEQIHRLFDDIEAGFELAADGEITVEMNPEGLTADRLQAFRQRNVNRISLGIQTWQDRYLKYLGRLHDAAAAREAYAAARRAGFTNISCDLMISFPGQSEEELMDDLQGMIGLAPEHISLYSLTIEPPSRFFARGVRLPSDETQASHLTRTIKTMAAAGYGRYEVSNFALPGFASRHNINYWKCGDYIGLGMGAHSHLQGERFSNVDRFQDYVKRVGAGASPRAQTERLSDEQRLVEALIFGLRMTAGVVPEQLESRFGCRIDEERRMKIDAYIKEGLLARDDAGLRATPAGMMVLDEISSRLF